MHACNSSYYGQPEAMVALPMATSRISDSSALQSMVAIRNSLPWPGLLVAAGTTAAVLEQPEEQQGSTVVGGVLVSDFIDQLETLKWL